MVTSKKIVLTTLLMALFIGLTFGQVSAQAANPPVGFVDFVYLVENHPDTAKANEILKAEQEAAQKEFKDKSATLGDKEKWELDRQLGQQLQQKKVDLLKPITEKVVAAVKEVANAKGLSLVISKREVVYGEVDITQDVLAKLNGK